jgi:membrane-associated protein
MDLISELLKGLYDLDNLLRWGGYTALALIVFVETGLLIGFFLPGDSLLVTAGVLAAQGLFNIWVLIPLLVVSAIVGDSVGYWIGAKAGPAIFSRPDSLLFSQKNLRQAQGFYDKYGGKTIVIARFVPVVRTFAPVVAGAAQMDYRKFLTYNIMGGLIWVLLTTLGGYFLGNVIGKETLDKNLHYVIFGVILVSLLPIAFEYFKARQEAGKSK